MKFIENRIPDKLMKKTINYNQIILMIVTNIGPSNVHLALSKTFVSK
jgi:hypothetical protein